MKFGDMAAMDHAAFIASFGELFEHSPWVAEAAWAQRPFANEAALHDAMMTAVRGAPKGQQIAFLNMHPEGAGLNALTRDELLELRSLNAVYAQRHGFPFIIAVLGHTKPQIFEALRTRTERDTAREVDEALGQIAQITRRRLHALFAPRATN
jgi:2-oxo-4-hydroxy-4-carboxy-5-ureidoimidazoline decarboxylase